MKTEEESPKIEEEISTEKVIDTHEEEDSFEGTDKKLSDLMKRGWIMLSESCPLESCRCPLMKSPDGQKYCVQCEMWIFDHKPVKKKKFGELVPFKKPRENHTEISKKYKVNDSTVYAHIRKYSIPTRQIGNYVYVPKKEIDNLYKGAKQ